MLRFAAVFLSVAIIGSCIKRTHGASLLKIHNGMEEKGLPFVVELEINEKGRCTGSFVSPELLVTAAHCVDNASTVSTEGVKVGREHIFIHPDWPSNGETCKKKGQPANDVALVRFPPGTYKGESFAELSPRAPKATDTVKIAGFGHNDLEVFTEYCRLSVRKSEAVETEPEVITKDGEESGQCVLRKGTLKGVARHVYEEVFSYPLENPVPRPDNAGCPARCTESGLDSSLKAQGKDWRALLADSCGGNFRDRPYKESGLGTKRSGTNKLSYAGKGIFKFYGKVAESQEAPEGIDVVSGAGDSGGPLFIELNGAWKLAGVTHGGGVVEQGLSVAKSSIYVDLNSASIRSWFANIVEKEKLNFPGHIVKL
ncbi:MAG: Trypsin [Pseudomonadota bacterium]